MWGGETSGVVGVVVIFEYIGVRGAFCGVKGLILLRRLRKFAGGLASRQIDDGMADGRGKTLLLTI